MPRIWMCHNWETKRRENDYRWFSCPLKSHSDRDWKSLLALCIDWWNIILFFCRIQFSRSRSVSPLRVCIVSRQYFIFHIRHTASSDDAIKNWIPDASWKMKFILTHHGSRDLQLSLEIVWIQYEIAVVVHSLMIFSDTIDKSNFPMKKLFIEWNFCKLWWRNEKKGKSVEK